MTTFPNRPLMDPHETLAGAKLLNSVIVVCTEDVTTPTTMHLLNVCYYNAKQKRLLCVLGHYSYVVCL